MAEHDAEQREDRTEPPTIEDFAGLPRTAMAAYTARCARRAQPLFRVAWPDAPTQYSQVLEATISRRESAAAMADLSLFVLVDAEVPAVTYGAQQAGIQAAAAIMIAADVSIGVGPAFRYDHAAANAAGITLGAVESHYSRHADVQTLALVASAFNRVEWRDLDLVRAAMEREEWRNKDNWPTEFGPSVPPEFFGALWPEGEPEGWPADGREERAGDEAVEIQLDVPEDIEPERLEELLAELAGRLEDMHRAEGGRGVVIDAVEIPLGVGAPKAVCP